MIAWLVLMGCPVSRADLTHEDPRLRADALDRVPTWQARAEVHRLERWAASPPTLVQRAALRALVRADSVEALAVVQRQAARSKNVDVTEALAAERTRRGCDLLAELYRDGKVMDRERVGAALCRPAIDTLACGRSLGSELSCSSR